MTPTDPQPTSTERTSAEPTSAQWQSAETVLYAHMENRNKRIHKVTREARLGTTFWIGYDDGGGKHSAGAAFVRGQDVFTTPGAATLSEILRRDRFLETRYISARAFYAMLDLLEYLPTFKGSAQLDVLDKDLHPSWSFSDEGAIYTLYANRPTSLPTGVDVGDRNIPVYEVTRARLTIRPDYSIVPWTLEDIELPIRSGDNNHVDNE